MTRIKTIYQAISIFGFLAKVDSRGLFLGRTTWLVFYFSPLPLHGWYLSTIGIRHLGYWWINGGVFTYDDLEFNKRGVVIVVLGNT